MSSMAAVSDAWPPHSTRSDAWSSALMLSLPGPP
jgi:hypothetical protein